MKKLLLFLSLLLAISSIHTQHCLDTSNLPNPNEPMANGPVPNPFTVEELRDIQDSGKPASSYPVGDYTLYLVDLHFLSGNISAQYIAYHYCHFVTKDLMQCALFNDTTSQARFIGNEFFITKELFDTLPMEERHLWHSHPYEIKSGLFVAPDLSAENERKVMTWLMGTFGKVADTWQYTEDFPFGAPQLGMALALDSQVNWTLADEMDKVLNLPTTYLERRQMRADMVVPEKTEGADNYLETGIANQYEVYQIMIENHGRTLGICD